VNWPRNLGPNLGSSFVTCSALLDQREHVAIPRMRRPAVGDELIEVRELLPVDANAIGRPTTSFTKRGAAASITSSFVGSPIEAGSGGRPRVVTRPDGHRFDHEERVVRLDGPEMRRTSSIISSSMAAVGVSTIATSARYGAPRRCLPSRLDGVAWLREHGHVDLRRACATDRRGWSLKSAPISSGFGLAA